MQLAHLVDPALAAPPTGAPDEPLVFRDVYERHAEFVWTSLRRLGVRDADADDVCQEVFVVVHRKLADAGTIVSLRGWLFNICLRAASDYRRRAHIRRERVTDDVAEGDGAGPMPSDEADLRRARVVLDGLLAELDDDRRAVFILYELEELPMYEIAASLGCPLQTAYSRLHAARKAIEAGIRRIHAKGRER